MQKKRRKACSLALAAILLFLPSFNSSSAQTILSQEEYDKQYQVYLETYVATPELISAWEYYLPLYPENNQIRYYLMFACFESGQYAKAKMYAKEALQYDPDNTYFAYQYSVLCTMVGDIDEIQSAAEYLLALTLPIIPPVGQLVKLDEWDNNYYKVLEYYFNAVETLQEVYAVYDDEEKMLQYNDWILQRKDDSDLGYEFGLLSMFRLAVYYGNSSRFRDMEYWLEQYFGFEATATEKDDEYKQVQTDMQDFTRILQRIYNAYLSEGDSIDIDAIIEGSL